MIEILKPLPLDFIQNTFLEMGVDNHIMLVLTSSFELPKKIEIDFTYVEKIGTAKVMEEKVKHKDNILIYTQNSLESDVAGGRIVVATSYTPYLDFFGS